MDFDKLLSQSMASAPIEPHELYASLLDKAAGYGYLRDVQGQVLSSWHQRRHERDLILKVNTGSGKTIVGLIILRSYLNDRRGPAVYVASTPYLVDRVELGRPHCPRRRCHGYRQRSATRARWVAVLANKYDGIDLARDRLPCASD
ncbi:MAG: DEAD/DEAH box helicase family protein [Pseudonocardiaceae bacterium]